MKKRIPALLLAALLAVTGVASSSCKKDEKKPVTNTPGISTGESENGLPPLVLPEIDGAGEDFDVFIAYNVANTDFIAPEEETGNTIQDILYQRNQEVQNRFNVNFKYREGDTNNGTATPIIRSLIQSGDETYEVFINVQHVGVPLIYEELFVEWGEDMPHANLDNPWWYQNVKRDLNFNDKIYVTAGAYNFNCLRGAAVLTFNKTILDEIGLEYPYQLVLDGEWTVDKMIEYMKAGQKDLDGNGTMDPDNDRYGMAGWKYEMMPAFFVGMGGNPVVKNDQNLPALNINNERTFNVMNKLLEVFKDGNGAFSNSDGVKPYSTTGTMFREGRLLFNDATLEQLAGYRDMEDDFGAVPYPKLDVDQEEYYSRIVNYASLTYIPVTNQKLELTSAILEHMAYLSYRDLIPAFYDEILTIKTNRDFETEDMVNIVRDSARFMDSNFLGTSTIYTIVESGTNTLSSTCAAQSDAWDIKLQDFIEFWED